MKANGQIVIGISSYQEFPGKITNPFDDRHTTEADWEIYKATDGWLHCFRYLQLYLTCQLLLECLTIIIII